MPNYRRVWVPGGTYFFTVNLQDRRQRLLVEHIDALRGALRETAAARAFTALAAVVLPDHLHFVWSLPDGDADNAARWSHIKSLFTRALRERGAVGPDSPVWQHRYWERLIRDERDLLAHIDYVHYNPVRHGLVERALDWPHSSFHRFVRDGALPPDWGTSMAAFSRERGEVASGRGRAVRG
jgi:putative transposase